LIATNALTTTPRRKRVNIKANNKLRGGRFSDYDGALLSEFVSLRRLSPDTLFVALLREKLSVDDILKISRALKQLI